MVFGLFSKKKMLLKAIENGEVDVVSSLLEGFDKFNETFSKPDNKDVAKWTYLLHSCKYGNAEIVQSLLEKGADTNDQDSDGKPPLYWAACNDDDEEAAKICTLLIEKGVDINHQATDGRIAVIGAIINGNNKTLEMLLGAGADPNIQRENGTSALYFAASRSAEAVKMLLEHNAEPNIENMHKATPIFEAACAADCADNIEIISALVESGADINHEIETEDGEKLYPLDAAFGYDNQAVAMYLFTKSAKYNPDISDVEVMVHANEEQASFHDELGAEGKYHYLFHQGQWLLVHPIKTSRLN
jgi:ankyrin repeat protein